MHRRQQTDHPSTKVQYHVTSPYIQLLESKKKVYGHKYDKNNKSFTGYVKPSPASGTSIFSSSYKPFKSVSSQKSKNYLNKSGQTKKKRTHTEQVEDKMHESLFIHMNEKEKPEFNASKSLFYADMNDERKYSHFQFMGQTGKKNVRQRHLSEKRHGERNQSSNPLENLKVCDIDSLIALIDNCVMEANEYISYLSEKIESLKEELIAARSYSNDLEIALKNQEECLKKKETEIDELERKVEKNKDKSKGKEEMPFEVKNLLQIIEKINDENVELKKKLDQLQKEETFPMKGSTEKGRSKDFYNEIHSNIDILNISIGGAKKHESPHKSKDLIKKYKFIKQKHK